jgi:ABC-type hemin transport system ATPase subunit
LQLEQKLGRPVKVSIISAQSQVVAGTNYLLKLKADDSHVDTKYYNAQVWAKLPAHGGAVEVTKLEEVSADAAGAGGAAGVGTTENSENPEVDAAASYAVQQLSQQSNSLFPFQLKKVISATKTSGSNGKEGVTHYMRLRVAQGSMPDQEFEVDVVEAAHGHVLKSSKLMV